MNAVFYVAHMVSKLVAFTGKSREMAKKRAKQRLRRGLSFADYLVVWRAIKSGKIADWAEAERLGLCKPKSEKGRPSKRLGEIIRKPKSTAAV